MGKRICKKTSRKDYVRCDVYSQRLFDELGGSITTERCREILDETRKFPRLNKNAVFVRNRKGVLVEIVGTKGKSAKYGVDLCGGIYYFDGNRVGKRKLQMIKAYFDDDIARAVPEIQIPFMDKVHNKIRQQARL